MLHWIEKLAEYGITIVLIIIVCLFIIGLIMEYLRRYAVFIIIALIVGVIGSLFGIFADEEKVQEEKVQEVKQSQEYIESSESDDFILPDSNTRILTDTDVQDFAKQDLRLARNEIFARHGYIFTADDLQQYFDRKSWYKPNEEFHYDLLSNIEKQNIDLIKSYE
ncbi:YARHG domain-containing protein [Bacillus sp. FJAT-29814]|uniref:YARHG domain-containing protein n=1 Tax=Bacillus sp. FJAT-29814 TaxID=1729688 RepID=UPI00082E3094|nr:YARHG domain-containing protein [Bacillus sp. FJAT-29814]